MTSNDRIPLTSQISDIVNSRFEYGWEQLRGTQIFITGGTGFIGRWLLECLVYAEERYDLCLHVTVLTRDSAAFARNHYGAGWLLTHPAIQFIEGDVRSFESPDKSFTHIIHAAHTSAYATFNGEDPLTQFDTAFIGARRVLDFALCSGVRRFLMLSSGSVYGIPLDGMECIPEDFPSAPLPQEVSAALNHGKRAAEFLCAYYQQQYGLETVIARCFTVIGPGIPLDIHYAIGNFIRDALWGEAITVSGDGTPIRSYLYVADLIVWLLVMLTRAPSGSVFNVGSDASLSILDLATLVRDTLAPEKPIKVIGGQQCNINRSIYVPSIERARAVLQLDAWTDLVEAILRTGNWYQLIGQSYNR